MSDDRLIEIEIALSHQEAALEELGGVVRAQAERLERLERLVALIAERSADAETPPAANVRPPHW